MQTFNDVFLITKFTPQESFKSP